MLILLISACSSKTNQAKIQSEATQNKGIVGRLTKQLVEEAHPTVDSTCCINEILQKKQCGLCKAACHVSTLDKITHPDFTHCDDCGICVAHCPAPVFTNSPSLTQKPQLQSRREAFASLFRQGSHSVFNLLPEQLRSSPHKNLWRKILLP